MQCATGLPLAHDNVLYHAYERKRSDLTLHLNQVSHPSNNVARVGDLLCIFITDFDVELTLQIEEDIQSVEGSIPEIQVSCSRSQYGGKGVLSRRSL